jgi:hypothetical protein
LIIIQDTREKIPWNFISYNKCKGQIIHSLSEGDYTLEAYPKLICIERKKSVVELAMNLGKKYKQFRAELNRLQTYRFRYVICEFPEQQLLIYPTGCKLPKKILNKLRMSGKFLHKRVTELTDEYSIEFIFCQNRFEAKDKAMELFLAAKEIYDRENPTR